MTTPEATHPMAYEAVECAKVGRSNRDRADKLAHQIYKDETGIDLPDIRIMEDADGNVWSIRAHVQVELVRRGGEPRG